MKLKLTEKRLTANRKNSVLGSKAWSKQCNEAYKANPTYCKHCNIILPQEKKRNLFCSTSCAAIYNNAKKDWSKIKTGPAPKVKQPKAPYSTLFKCSCNHCGFEWRNRTSQKYCNNCSTLYSHAGRAKYWFTFNVFDYPALFDLALITKHGFRDSKTNPNGITRDHKVSVNEAIRNNYNPYYIKHVMNCELMFFADNNKKKTKSSITYQELVRLVDDYDSLVGRIGFEPMVLVS